jgi:hypothetical protein
MSETIPDDDLDRPDALTPLAALLETGSLPFKTRKPAIRWLDQERVPYLLVGGRRFYRRRAVNAALERSEVTPTAA